MDEQLIEVQLDDTEIWPGLSLTFSDSDFFDANEATKVPKDLVDELREARRAEYAAEQKLAAWLIENGPDGIKQMRWLQSRGRS